MHPVTLKLAGELDVLYGLYQLALEYTGKLRSEPAETMDRWLDARQRLLSKTQTASKTASGLMKTFKGLTQVTENERALIREKKALVEDLLHDMQRMENETMRVMRQKMRDIRSELAGVHHKKKAASAYLNAPAAKMAVS